MKIEFTFYGEPTAKGRPRFTTRGRFPMAYTPAKTVAAENLFKLQSLRFKPQTPFTGPVILTARIYRSIPKSFSVAKREQALAGVLFPICRPDTDNFLKLILDSMNGIFFKDDSQVYQISAIKLYSLNPRIEIDLEA